MQELKFSNFNWKQYLKNYEDLVKVGFNTYQQCMKHYYLHGIHEGRSDNSLISNFKVPKEESVILFANARDEPGIKEWCAHHLLLGFDAIYILDHLSKEPLEQVLYNFDERVQTIKINNDSGGIKTNCMNYAKIIGQKLNAKWILYLDCDEFLILNKHPCVKDFLNDYNSSDQLAINWLMFGTNNHVKEPPGLVIENYTKCTPLIDQHVKCFVKPQTIHKIFNPHFFVLIHGFKTNNILNSLIPTPGPFVHLNLPYNEVPAYVAHYIYKSEEFYLNHKCSLPRDDTGAIRTIDKTIHEQYNEVDNFLIKERYTMDIKKFLNIETETQPVEQILIETETQPVEQILIETETPPVELEKLSLNETSYETSETSETSGGITIEFNNKSKKNGRKKRT
jgi:hypothetical protein